MDEELRTRHEASKAAMRLTLGAWVGLEDLENYLEVSESYFEESRKEFIANAAKLVKDLWPEEVDEEEADEFEWQYDQDKRRYVERFPRILRNSFLISAHSLLERELRSFCQHLQEEQQISIGWSDLRGDTLERLKKYCKLAHLALTAKDETWQQLNNYSMVRNCIVHNNGLIEGSQNESKLRPYAAQKGIVSHHTMWRLEEIALTKEFCQDVIKTMRTFLSQLVKAYRLQWLSQQQKASLET